MTVDNTRRPNGLTATTPLLQPNASAPKAPAAGTPAAPQTQSRTSGSGWTAVVANDGGSQRGATLKNARFAGDERFAKIASGELVMGVGATGETVTKLQQTLTDMGFADPDWARDGKFGSQAERGIRNFQVNASRMFPDVKVTGKLDAATLKAMDELAPPPGQQGQTKNVPKGVFVDEKGNTVKLKALALKDEHRTFIFDDKGNVAKVVINAVGMPPSDGMKSGNPRSRTNEGLMRVDGRWTQPEIVKNMGAAKAPLYGEHMVPLSWANRDRSPHEFHGTNEGSRLGGDVSHGCVRHSREGAKALYDALTAGDRVAILQNGDKRVQWR